MDKYFIEGLRTLWNLREDIGIEIFWRTVKNKSGNKYEYPVARLRGENLPFKYRHINQVLLNSSKEIRQKGAVRLLRKDISRLNKELDKVFSTVQRIKEHLNVLEDKEIPSDIKDSLVDIAKSLENIAEDIEKAINIDKTKRA
jgi:predicted nuclease with TOPRIM domain